MLAMLHSISYSGKTKYLKVTFQSQNNCTELKSSYFESYQNKNKHTTGLKLETACEEVEIPYSVWVKRNSS